jgi:voltage-gated potassium channel
VTPTRRDRPSWVRPLVSMAGVVLVFYAIPVGSQESGWRTAFSVLLTLVGVVVLAWAIVGQVRRQVTHSADENLHSLLMLFGLVVVVFAFGYYLLEEHSSGQFAGLVTRTDALYFTLSTMTTVGFGDVHAQGQIARSLVTLQLLFDVVFVAALVSTVAGTLRGRAENASRKDATHDPTG